MLRILNRENFPEGGIAVLRRIIGKIPFRHYLPANCKTTVYAFN